MDAKVIADLADYFTGPAVVHNSICLEMGGPSGKAAQRFFDVRKSLGIHGYDTKDKAVRSISSALLPD